MIGDIAILQRPDKNHILEKLQTFKSRSIEKLCQHSQIPHSLPRMSSVKKKEKTAKLTRFLAELVEESLARIRVIAACQLKE